MSNNLQQASLFHFTKNLAGTKWQFEINVEMMGYVIKVLCNIAVTSACGVGHIY